MPPSESPSVHLSSQKRVCFFLSLSVYVCVLNDPCGVDKRPFEGARTDGRTGRLSDRHRGLRLQCGRRHVASIPFHLCHFLSPALAQTKPNHDAALRHGFQHLRDRFLNDFKQLLALFILYINTFFLVWFYLQNTNAKSWQERRHREAEIQTVQLRNRNPMELIKIPHPKRENREKNKFTSRDTGEFVTEIK